MILLFARTLTHSHSQLLREVCSHAASVLLVVSSLVKEAVTLDVVVHRRGHLVLLPRLTVHWLTALASVKVVLELLGQATVLIGRHQQLLEGHILGHHVERSTVRVLSCIGMHTWRCLLAVGVHISMWLLVVTRQRLQVLLVHLIEWCL